MIRFNRLTRKASRLFTALAIVGAAATSASGVVTSYLPFDGSFDDLSGNGHTGIAIGNTTFTGTAPAQLAGQSSSASFDGAGDAVRLTNGHTIPFGGESGSTTQHFSASAWVNTDNTSTSPDGRIIFSKALDNVGGNHSAAFMIDGAGQVRFDNFFVNEVHGGPNLKNTGWRHTAVTFNDATNRYSLFVDGVHVANKVFNPALPATNLTNAGWELQIGDTKNATFPAPGDFKGNIAAAATYSHQVFAPDIADLAAGRATPLTLGQAASFQSYESLVLAKNPLVYYRFEEAAGATTAIDSSGNGKHGAYTGVTLGTTSPFAGLGNVGNFNGTNARIDTPALGTFAQSSLEVWINARAFSAGTITSLYSTDSFVAGNVHFNLFNNSTVEHTIAGGGPDDLFTPVNSFGLDDWYQIVATYDAADGGRTKIYLNGILLSTSFHTTGLPALFSDASVGSFNLSRYFNGQLDEFAIYGSVLSQEDVLAHLAARNGAIIVPEPMTGSMLLLATVALLRRRRFA